MDGYIKENTPAYVTQIDPKNIFLSNLNIGGTTISALDKAEFSHHYLDGHQVYKAFYYNPILEDQTIKVLGTLPTSNSIHDKLKNITDVTFNHNVISHFQDFLPSYYYDNMKALNIEFQKEFSIYFKYIEANITFAKKRIDILIKEISLLNFLDFALELTSNNTIKFTLLFENDFMYMISTSLDEDSPYVSVISEFKDGNLIKGTIDSIANFISEFKN